MSDTTTNLSIAKIPAASPDVHTNGPAEAVNAALDTIDSIIAARTANVAPGQNVVTLASGDGAISVKTGTVVITKGSAAALTLAAPTAGTDDGKILRVVSATAFAHVVTTPANNILDGTSSTKDTATFAAHAGASIVLEAYNGNWSLLSLNAVVLTEV